LKENIDVLVSRADDLGRRLHNKTRQAIRARASSAKLRGDLIRSKHTRAVQTGRLGRRKADGIRKALLDARAEPNKHWMKGKGGIFTENAREMIRDLVALKVPAMNVDPVIHTVGRGLGRKVQDHVSARQINRVVEEGGIASDLQVTSEIRGSKGKDFGVLQY
jgi:predicted nucleotide-binding protein (sugar kinase/HSP70/actin superfamily)